MQSKEKQVGITSIEHQIIPSVILEAELLATTRTRESVGLTEF